MIETEKKLNLNEVAELAKKATELWKRGVLHFEMYAPCVQMDKRAFFKLFDRREDIQMRIIADAAYQYIYSITEQGAEFKCATAEPVDLKGLRERLREQDYSDICTEKRHEEKR